ncbi:hypothetical protein D9V37_15085 [Nocardioides mangrovicus]|uniref:DUF3558 domain-containing protein n=1 Tax=Nocardioides mangrovicus TaxID=2478913 RepID=A0A3L8NW75_9ACTN|nr:hypothetical protein [Nocardioides mangrovicus]RLV47506.1 hypothetical protein D9V37_15085 [Nocardioides mangrovicus]
MLVLAAVSVAALAACGHQAASVDLSAISTSSTTGSTVCGALPRHAVELALGTDDLRVVKRGAGLDAIGSTDVTSCQVYRPGSTTWSLDVAFADFKGTENQQLLAEFQQRSGNREKKLPSDLGTGLVDSPWSTGSPSAQVTMMNGEKQLQITLARVPARRDQSEDVLALARLLKPYFA